MFIYHSQLEEIQSVVKKGEIGEVRLYRIHLAFPNAQLMIFVTIKHWEVERY